MDGQACFLNLCRLCLRKQGISHVFKTKGLLLDIKKIVGLNVLLADNLPQMICQECSAVIKNIKELRKIAQVNDRHMRVLVGDKLEQSESAIETFIIETNNSDPNEEDTLPDISNYLIESEMVIIEENSCIKEYSVTASSELFSHNEPKSRLEIQMSPDREQPIKIKSEKNIEEYKSSSNMEINYTEGKSMGKRKNPSSLRIKSEKKINEEYELSLKSKEAETSISTKIFQQKQPTDETEMKLKTEQEGSYKCQVCGKLYASRKKMYHHGRHHSKSHACPIEACGKKFACKGDLDKHLRVHTGEKPYECELCSRRFTQLGTLRKHSQTVH